MSAYVDRMYDITETEKHTDYATKLDFAERHGKKAVRDKAKELFEDAKDSIIKITELVLVLNWKAWEWEKSESYDTIARELTGTYSDLYEKYDNYVLSHFTGDDLVYFLETTD